MAKLTVQRNTKTKTWTIAIDGEFGDPIPDVNSSMNSGYLQCERQLAALLLKQMPNYPERAYRIAHTVIELAKDSDLAVSLETVVNAHPDTQVFT